MVFEGNAGFIGAGKMGGALIEGIVNSNLLPASRITAFDVAKNLTSDLAGRIGINAAGSAEEVVENSDIVFICVKPDQFQSVAGAIRAAWPERSPALVTIMAGVRISRIRELLELSPPVVRVMPNVACLISQGVAGVAFDPEAPDEVNDFVFEIFEALGGAVRVAEEKLDAVTAIGGSGPAYFFMFIEALMDAGVKLGLPRDSAEKLAIRTAVGSCMLAEQSGASMAELRARVSSPGGTTVAATAVLESAGFRGIVIEAVEAACERSVELGS